MIRVLVSLSLSVFSIEAALAQSIIIDTREWARQLRAPLTQPQITNTVNVQVNNNRIDISQAIRTLERRLDQSRYRNFDVISELLSSIKFRVLKLCDNSNNQNLCRENLNDDLVRARRRLLQKQFQRILFPDNLRLSRECTGKLAFKQVHEMLSCISSDNFCSVTESSCLTMFLIGYVNPGSKSLAQIMRLMNQVKKLDPSCLGKIISHLTRRSEELRRYIPETCEIGITGKVCRELKQHYGFLHQRLDFLLSSLPSNKFLLSDVDTCSSYKSGERRLVIVPQTHILDDVYIVKRNADGSYTIPLAMEFEAANDYDYDYKIPSNQVPNEYFKKIKDCITQYANPNLLGPNGEKLNIEIQDARNSVCIPKYSISITAQENRSLENAYAADVTCPTIIHEILHKLGLNDEYLETELRMNSDDSPLAYGCRAIQTNSIMSNSEERYCNVEQIALLDKSLCQSRTSCIRARSIRYRKLCHPRRNKHCFRRGINRRYCQASLLSPAHFDALLYGDCSEKENVRLFRECSNLAYQHLDLVEDNCQDKKKYCESQDILNRTLQQPTQTNSSARRSRRRSINRRGIR